jgi:hypothetical protein
MGRRVRALARTPGTATAGGGYNGSILRDPAGCGPPQPRPPCLSLHIRPLGIFSRFADRRLSVFVIEFLRSAAARGTMPGVAAVPLASGSTMLRKRSRSRSTRCPKLLRRPDRLTRDARVHQSGRSVGSGFRPGMYEDAWRPSCVLGPSFNQRLPKQFPSRVVRLFDGPAPTRPPAHVGR